MTAVFVTFAALNILLYLWSRYVSRFLEGRARYIAYGMALVNAATAGVFGYLAIGAQ